MRHLTAPFLFVLASLLPAGCLLLGAVIGGVWPVLAVLSMTIVVGVMDRLGPIFETTGHGLRFLPWLVACAHFATLAATIWAVCQPDHLDALQKLALVFAMGLFAGQVSNACAHELIHRTDQKNRALGTAIYVSILNGQHVSSHLLVHHVYAGTEKDPNSAPVGQGFYRFMLKASLAEFLGGWRAETRRRTHKKERLHPYMLYLSGAAAALVAAVWLGGAMGAAVLVILSLHAQMQLLVSDYVQHYGLRRKIASNGKPEPMGLQHSWNAPQPYSSALMMNAPRHSDHHMHPARSFDTLRYTPQSMPTLPYSMPVMGAIALVPPLWRRLMDSRARVWAGPHDPTTHATPQFDPLFSTS